MIIGKPVKKIGFFALACICIIGFFASCESFEVPVETPAEEPAEIPVDVPVDVVPYRLSFTSDLQQALESNSIEDVLAIFDTIPVEHQDDADLNYIHASLLLSAGKLEEATTMLDELQINDPENTDIKFLSALILKADGDARGSIALVKEILEDDPGNSAANVEMANSQMSVKNFTAANRYFSEGLRTDPEHPEALFGFALTAWYLEDDDDDLRKNDTAKNAFLKLSQVDPENSMAWSYLAKLEAEEGNYKGAMEYLQTAVKYEDDYYYHWLDMGSYYRAMNDYEGAEMAWTRAIELDPEYFLTYGYRGSIYEEQDRYDEALSDYQNLIKYNPNYHYAYESIGMLLWRKEDWVEARNSFLKAYSANPENKSYALMVSATYRKEGKIADNKEFLSLAMRNMDRQSLDYLMLRLYYDGLGDGNVLNKVSNEKNQTLKGKMLFYMALFYELEGNISLANKFYLEVAEMQAPVFFEYRLNEWAIDKMPVASKLDQLD